MEGGKNQGHLVSILLMSLFLATLDFLLDRRKLAKALKSSKISEKSVLMWDQDISKLVGVLGFCGFCLLLVVCLA